MSHNKDKGLGEYYSDKDVWVIVRTYNEFINLVKNNFSDINLISMDHDLACFDEEGKEMTGKDAVNFLIEYCLDNNLKFPDWYVHSDNTIGKKNMTLLIINYLKTIEGKNILNFNRHNSGIVNNQVI